MANSAWPDLPYGAWSDTLATLHMWCQIVGKIRLVQTPWINHSWHVTFYPTTRGITTSPIPYGSRTFAIEFDFRDHMVRIDTSDGASRAMTLRPHPVAEFYNELFMQLSHLGIDVHIHAVPNEVPVAVPFQQDVGHASYDPEYANRFWQLLLEADRVMTQFRAGFIGKCSPVQLFWGGLDLACTRFSGRPAPQHPGGIPNCPDWVTREAYSHEVSSCGFWPGNDAMPFPVFYAYAYPEPPGYKTAAVRPARAFYDGVFGEFILPYDQVRLAPAPDAVLLEFLHSTYAAAADLGQWDRQALERSDPRPRAAKAPRGALKSGN
ncbi:MAG: DUF5996 family protein [Pseudomonadota bacterium]